MIDPSVYGLEYVAHLSYIGIFFAIAFSGYALPVPEEIVLIIGGYLAAQGLLNIFVIMILSVIAAICGDSLIFYLSGHGSRFTQKYHDRVEKTHAGWYVRQMKKHPARTIFLSRFIIGFRFLNPLVSGLLKISWSIFLISTSISALLYIPLIVLLGYYLNNNITKIIHIALSVRHAISIGFVIATVLLILLFFKNLIEPKTEN